MGQITGFEGLVFDPAMFGGGAHENLDGQDLDPHVDFNYDEAQQLHRRLNLIVYLNQGWQIEWGGALQLRIRGTRNRTNGYRSIRSSTGRFCLGLTNHGFPRIQLPESERHRSRKSISIYLYTRERPAGEIAPLHDTFYVQCPLLPWVRRGQVLNEDECQRHASKSSANRRFAPKETIANWRLS